MYWLPPYFVQPSALTRIARGAPSRLTPSPRSGRRGGAPPPGRDLDGGDRFLWVRVHPTQQREADLQPREGLAGPGDLLIDGDRLFQPRADGSLVQQRDGLLRAVAVADGVGTDLLPEPGRRERRGGQEG